MKYILLLFAMMTFSFASIGKITAINGEAFALRGATAIPLELNSPIEKKDKIKTMANTKLQIVFNDHTVISLGQKTEFKIDDYIYSTSKVKASFSVPKGIFKSITGKIGKIDHSKFKLKTKNATIGVRGTTFIGVVDRDKETIACTSGEIVVENDFGIVAVKRGEMTIVRDFQPPKVPKALDKKFFQKVKSVKPAIKRTLSQEVKTSEIVTKNDTFSNDIKQEIPQVFVDKTEKADVKNSIKEDEIIKVFKSIISKKEDKARENNHGNNIADIAKDISDSTTQNVSEFFGSDKQTKTDKKDKWFNKNKKEDKARENNHGNNIADIAKDISDSTTQNVSEFFGGNLEAEEGGDFSTIDMEQENSQQDSITEVAASNDLGKLREKVGGVDRLHYNGTVSGDNIISDNNHINLDFDLGHGTVSGNVHFVVEKQRRMGRVRQETWDTDLSGGFDRGNRFNLQAVSDGYSGSGSVDLVGEHLEQAQGSMSLTKGKMFNTDRANINFTANKTN